MLRLTNVLILSLCGTVTLSRALANDGRDKSRQSGPSQLQLFPAPLGEGSGYRFLAGDGPGGADGTEMFRWVRPIGASLVRIAAFETTKALGQAPFPMAVFDLTSENGDTPVEMSAKAPPRGRHPGGSHDGGLNMDLGYYLTSVKGKDFTPDLAACTDHFEALKPGAAALKDAGQCQGPADRLAVPHQAYFLLEIAKINRQDFRGDLIEEIGIDLKARLVVIEQLNEWIKSQRFGATEELRDDLARSFTSDEWDGWAGYHHHHIHVRMRDLSMLGEHRRAFEALGAREKRNDLDLMLKNNPKESSPLWARLLSQGLSRSIEAEVLNLKPSPATEVRLQSDDSDAQKADPSRAPRVSATWDLPDGFSEERSEAAVKAEVFEKGKSSRTLKTSLALPRKPYYLGIAVDPAQIRGRVLQAMSGSGPRLTIKLDYPQTYASYITSVSYQIAYANQDPSDVPVAASAQDDFAYAVPLEKNNPIQNITAVVVLSSRMKVKIPVYNLPVWNTKL